MKVIKCLICGQEFETKTTGKYCSSDCKKIVKSNSNKVYHKKNKDIINKKRKEHYNRNKDWYKKRDKTKWEKYVKENPNLRKNRNLSHLSESERKKEIKKKYNKLRKRKYITDEVYNLKTRFRSLLNKKIREGSYTKTHSTLDFLGCDWKTFKLHIESQFKDGMSWDNRGEWDLDHIIPISEGKTLEDIYLLSHYSNFQPLWRKDNIKKSNTW